MLLWIADNSYEESGVSENAGIWKSYSVLEVPDLARTVLLGRPFSGWAPIRHVNGSAIESLKFNHGRSACCGDEASEMVTFVFIFGCLCHDKMHRQLVGVTRDVSPSPGLLDLVTCIQLTLFSFRLPLRTSFSGLFLSSGTLSVDPSVTSRVPKSPTSVQLTFVALLDSFYLCI